MNTLKALTKYCEQHSTPPSKILYELKRETHLKTLAPQMLSGPLQGRLLSLISKLVRPKRILEIGTFTGYAALCLAEGLSEDGLLHTIEANRELEYLIRKYIKKAGLEQKIVLHLGGAEQVIPTLEEQFDLVFIDAGKQDYGLHYDLVIEKVNSGGLILADNVLWSGKVVHKKHDKDTRLIDAFNKKILADQRVENLTLPIRDGLLLARKK